MLLRVRTHKTPCGLRAAICVLRPVLRPAAKYAAGRSTQIAARRLHNFPCVRTRNRIYVNTHAARKRNCWKFRCDISGNTEKVEICSTRCGLRPAARGLRQSMNRPLVIFWSSVLLYRGPSTKYEYSRFSKGFQNI